MGVYLPNVDMPKDDKVVTIQICPDGSIWKQYRGTVPNAKAVPVPPHGRLIDADALISRCKDEKGSYYGHDSAVIGEAVEFAPTVIPADAADRNVGDKEDDE